MIRYRKLKYCPRTKHCTGWWKLKKAIAVCCYQKDGLCGHAPSLLRYLHANNIKVRLTDNYICVARRRTTEKSNSGKMVRRIENLETTGIAFVCNCSGNHTTDTAGRWYCPVHGYVPALTRLSHPSPSSRINPDGRGMGNDAKR
jgi:hypothetical protein